MDLFDIAAKITLDTSGYEKDLAGAENKGSGFANKLKKGLGTAAKAVAAGVGSAVTAVSAFIGNSVKEYANYEQLVGGVETLFKKSAPIVEEYAANAYKTAGLSANEYMETVTSFSASLLQSLGGDTEKAAQYADVAITDMSDNANKMGTSMESIQAAYQGFAKQNYTMLDNLKLGYGGTKTEMERLILDAESLNSSFSAARDENGDLAMSYSDIVDAIHIVQTEMGITGTTAEEASTTIQGSVSSMKAAWSNLMVGIADENADFEGLVNNMVSTVSTVFENIIPRVEQSLMGVTQLVSGLGPIIANELPGIVNNVLPELSNVAVDLILTLANSIVENLPMLVETAFSIISQLVTSIGEALPELIPAAVSMIIQIVEGLLDNIDMLVDAAISLIMGLVDGIMTALPLLIAKAPEIIGKLVSALIRNLPKIISMAPQIIMSLIQGIISALPDLLLMGPQIIAEIVSGIVSSFQDLFGNGEDMVEQVKSGFSSAVGDAVSWGSDMIQNFINGITAKAKDLIGKVKEVAGKIKSFLGFSEPDEGPLADFHTYAPDMMNLFMKGINDNKRRLADTVASAFDFENLMTAPSMNMNGVPALAGAGAGVGGIGGGINLYIDGNKLVGATSQKMDRNLGDMQKIRARFGGR